ncbi:MAG: tryptophan--tRNA ligase [Candidatus Ancillula sp.]|jgi:tryptophanyl-tRNA synthetase|nr:tryptophan--tRNA ligase [Candidatus Ancillula sp.]
MHSDGLGTFSAAQSRSKKLEEKIRQNHKAFRVLTGERPTGLLHIGHLFGSIMERVRLQQLGTEVFVLIADYQVMTDRDELGAVTSNAYNIILDNLAAGLDPEVTTFFVHSQIPELNQLVLPFLSLVSESELHRNPTVKAELEASGGKMSGLMLIYPIHQAADILFCKGNVVPVGKDQLPHIEIARVIARRFNERFCGDGSIFPLPEALLSNTSLLPGLDGRKMSKSFGNAISLSMTNDDTAALIRRSETDSTREISYDPENRPGISALLDYIVLARGQELNAESLHLVVDEINSDPKYGAGLLKQKATDAINDFLEPHRTKRAEYAKNMDYITEVLKNGNIKAREIAATTLHEVSVAMGTVY